MVRSRLRNAGAVQRTADVNSITFATREVEYGFLELARYKTALRAHVFGIDGVVSLDVSERENRVKIGLTAPRYSPDVRALLERIGIPDEAVVFWEVEEVSVASLDLDDAQPQGLIQGGWRINGGGGGCTLGFPAKRASNGAEVWVTASHCTLYDHQYDGGAFYQPSRLIGYEILDPPPHTCGIFPDLCRNSDAALISASAQIHLGKIARTTQSSGCDQCSAPLTINLNNPTFTIREASGYLFEDQTVHKVGQTTGWTYGAVEDVCADYEVDGWVRQCSDRVDFSVQPGDSGSPVFSVNPDGTITLRGIVWGWVGWPYSDGLMSNFGRIEMDLESLVVAELRARIVGPNMTSGPITVPTNATCMWSADVDGGMPPFSYQWQKDWPTVGTGAQLYLDTGSSSTSFNLTLTVTDGDAGTNGDMSFVTVSPSAPMHTNCYPNP